MTKFWPLSDLSTFHHIFNFPSWDLNLQAEFEVLTGLFKFWHVTLIQNPFWSNVVKIFSSFLRCLLNLCAEKNEAFVFTSDSVNGTKAKWLRTRQLSVSITFNKLWFPKMHCCCLVGKFVSMSSVSSCSRNLIFPPHLSGCLCVYFCCLWIVAVLHWSSFFFANPDFAFFKAGCWPNPNPHIHWLADLKVHFW